MLACSAIDQKKLYDYGPGVTLNRSPESMNTSGTGRHCTVRHNIMPPDSMDGMRLTGSMK